jgi:tetratricopeptide (TPR) repeat protein
MAALLGALTLLLQLGAAASPARRGAPLTAVAQASARPRECAVTRFGEPTRLAGNVWELARQPNLDRYCSLLARGFAELSVSPQAARETALLADRTAPGHATPLVLAGRAAAAMGGFADASLAFDRARAVDSRSVEDPGAMRDWARTLAHTGRASEALSIYRALAPRLALFLGGEDRGTILLEAAELAFSLGPASLDDALAFLGEAREIPLHALRYRVLAELALALDRHHMTEEAATLLSQIARDFGQGKLSPTEQGATELDAAMALATEAVDPVLAAEGWRRYLAGPSGAGPWGEHARTRLEGLRKRPAGHRVVKP